MLFCSDQVSLLQLQCLFTLKTQGIKAIFTLKSEAMSLSFMPGEKKDNSVFLKVLHAVDYIYKMKLMVFAQNVIAVLMLSHILFV